MQKTAAQGSRLPQVIHMQVLYLLVNRTRSERIRVLRSGCRTAARPKRERLFHEDGRTFPWGRVASPKWVSQSPATEQRLPTPAAAWFRLGRRGSEQAPPSCRTQPLRNQTLEERSRNFPPSTGNSLRLCARHSSGRGRRIGPAPFSQAANLVRWTVMDKLCLTQGRPTPSRPAS